MRLDPYQLCPCGSGKKIKFCCCKDIMGDLSRIVRMLDGEQHQAALEALEKALAQYPNRDALLALKSIVQIHLGQLDEAEETVALFKAQVPDSCVAWAQSAMLNVGKRKLDSAVTSLQRALEVCGDELPVPVCEAIGAVAELLLAANRLLAARAHLQLYTEIMGEEDPSGQRLLESIERSPNLPLLLKEDGFADECLDTVSWKGEFDEAVRLAMRGAWLAARKKFQRIVDTAPTHALAVKNIAVLEGWLGNTPAMISAYRRYSKLDETSLEDAVEAEAIAQLLDAETYRRKIDVLKVVYELRDPEPLMEKLLSDRQSPRLPVDPSQMVAEGEPPPKGMFWFLDRPPRSAADLTLENVSKVIGEILVFGKQTDRQARLELTLSRTADFDEKLNNFLRFCGEHIGPAQHESVVAQHAEISEVLTSRLHLPEDTSEEQRLAIQLQQQERNVLEVWPNLAMSVLDDKTPREVCSDPRYRIPLLAAVLLLDLNTQQKSTLDLDFNRLRDELGLPTLDIIDPTSVQVSRLPLVRLSRLPAEKLSDDQLVAAYTRASITGARIALRGLAREVVNRDSLNGRLDKAVAYALLAQVATASFESIEYLEKAQKAASAAGKSPAVYMISELSIRLRQSDVSAAQRLLDTIQRRHGKEPGVPELLVNVLASFGLVSAEGRPVRAARPARDVPAEATPGAGPAEIWTPDRAAASDAGHGEPDAGKPKIWVPGMD